MKAGRYHHGNLPAALIDAALEMIAEHGVTAMTLRAVADRVGVSHTAPYRHFSGKAALLTAVACDGYESLTHRLRLARHGARSPEAALSRMAESYLDFATEHADQFRLMLTAEGDAADGNRVADTAQRVGDTIGACLAQLGARRRAQDDVATLLWSQWHGTTSLMLNGTLTAAEAKHQVRRAVEAAIATSPPSPR
jgi:AcrR family transcriptional regulator